MNSEVNIKILLAARPQGFPEESDFEIVESEIPKVEEGHILVKTEYLSLDPYMRGRMNDVKSYFKGNPMYIGTCLQFGVRKNFFIKTLKQTLAKFFI